MAEAVWIDCDPGQDDAIMLMLAMASPELDIKGISAVAGNVPLAKTARNIRLLAALCGRADIPLHAGLAAPLKRAPITAEAVHGQEGIDGMMVGIPSLRLRSQDACAALADCLSEASPRSVTLVVTGPQSTVGKLIEIRPDCLQGIKSVIIMGGAMREAGNWTPSAEFNILADPEAARLVLNAGLEVVYIGLDITHQLLVTAERLRRLAALPGPVAEAAVGMLSFFNRHDSAKYGTDGAPLHDPATTAYLLRPDLFTTKPVNIEIECASGLTLGHTAVDYWGVSGRAVNALWADSIDADGFSTFWWSAWPGIEGRVGMHREQVG